MLIKIIINNYLKEIYGFNDGTKHARCMDGSWTYYVYQYIIAGDNAVVIAMASRNLAPQHQKRAIFWGSAAAIIMRILLTIVAVQLLSLPFLKIIGGILLIYIGVQLMAEGDDNDSIESSSNIFQAIKTILIADLVMSLDNVVAVAAAA